MKARMQLIRNFLLQPFRREMSGKHITGGVVVLDFMKMKDCYVSNAVVVYYGYGGISLHGGAFSGCTLVFSGPAASALKANNAFADAGWPGVEKMFLSGREVAL